MKRNRITVTLSSTSNSNAHQTSSTRKKLFWIVSITLIVMFIIITPVAIVTTNKRNKTILSAETTTAKEQILSANQITNNTKWVEKGITVAGGHGEGNGLHQLNYPIGMYVDDYQKRIYIADSFNKRIVEWEFDAKQGLVFVDRNEGEEGIYQLNFPTSVAVDEKTDSIITCDYTENKIVRWSRKNRTNAQILISNILCSGLLVTLDADLYVSNGPYGGIRMWREGETSKTIPGSEKFDDTSYFFVDKNDSIYISDYPQSCVLKWTRTNDEDEVTVVAGGHGQGNASNQFFQPLGIVLDHLDNIYVADSGNNRIMRWLKGAQEGNIIIGNSTVSEEEPNRLDNPTALSFDRYGNLYVMDRNNQRILKFNVENY